MKWPEVTLGPLVKIRTGKLDANASSEDGEYPFFTCAVNPLKISTYGYEAECVLVAGNGDLNVKYYNGKFDAYQRTYIIESADRATLDVRYLYHFMEQYVGTLREMSIGGVIKYIKLGYLTDAKLPLPPLPEQRRIADILDKADAIRRKRKEAIALTEELLRSAFLDMFGDPATNPKGWEVRPLENYLGFVTSGSRGWAAHYSSEGERFIRSLDVQMDWISDDNAAYVAAPPGAEAERTRVQKDDVLLTITGSKIGRAARADAGHANAYVSQHVAILRLLPGLDPDVVTAFLANDRGGQALIARTQYGQTKPGLNLAQIRSFPIPVPPKEIQARIRATRAEVRETQHRLVDGLRSSEELFASLVHRAFAGGQSL